MTAPESALNACRAQRPAGVQPFRSLQQPATPLPRPAGRAAAAGTRWVRPIGNVAAIRMVYGPRPGKLWGTNSFTDSQVTATNSPFQVNDMVTSVTSARSPSGSFLAQLAADKVQQATSNPDDAALRSQALLALAGARRHVREIEEHRATSMKLLHAALYKYGEATRTLLLQFWHGPGVGDAATKALVRGRRL